MRNEKRRGRSALAAERAEAAAGFDPVETAREFEEETLVELEGGLGIAEEVFA